MRAMTVFLICLLHASSAISDDAGYRYTSGWLERDYAAPLELLYPAALKALQSLGAVIQNKGCGTVLAEIQAVKADRTCWVLLKALSMQSTEISVRVGSGGDEAAARKIHGRIDAELWYSSTGVEGK